MSSDSSDKFTLSYSKKEHNRRRNDIERDDLVLQSDSSDGGMKHFVGPAFLFCIQLE